MRKLMMLAVFAAGYVLGAQAGRQRYDQIMSLVTKVKNDPRVQEKAHQAVDLAKDQASAAASAAASKVTHNGQRAHHMAGPQGDLP